MRLVYRLLAYCLLFSPVAVAPAENTNGSAGRVFSANLRGLQNLTATTPAYQMELLRLMVAEANRVAHELNLPEKLPTEYRLAYQGGENRLYAHRSIANKPQW